MKNQNLFLTLFTLAIGFLCPICQGEITAPKRIDAGKLAVIQSTVPSNWAVYPLEYSTGIFIANNGTTVCFASPIEGKVTFFAMFVVDGKAEYEVKVLYNGIDPEEEIDDKEDDKPIETTLESIIKTTSINGVSKEDYKVVAESFESVIDGIERGTVRTPAGAREAFRGQLAYRAGQTNPAILNAFSGLLSAISDKVNYSSLATVKTDYQTIVKTLKEVKVKSAPVEKESPAETESNSGDCPNGQCPAMPNCANGKCNTYQWRLQR